MTVEKVVMLGACQHASQKGKERGASGRGSRYFEPKNSRIGCGMLGVGRLPGQMTLMVMFSRCTEYYQSRGTG